MQTLAPQQAESSRQVLVRRGSCAAVRRRVIFAASAAFFAGQLLSLAAQTAPAPTQPAAHPATPARTHAHKKPSPAKPAAQAAPAPAPAAPAAPQIPDWPANRKPADATVVWDSQGLTIQAANSSLDQILREVSLKTGIKVDGMGTDQRIFGTYGPGPAREVLSALLDGSGYNILMIGDQGQGTPRSIVLSGKSHGQAQSQGNANPSANNDDNAENDQPPEQLQPEPNPPAQMPPPGTPMRAPQP